MKVVLDVNLIKTLRPYGSVQFNKNDEYKKDPYTQV